MNTTNANTNTGSQNQSDPSISAGSQNQSNNPTANTGNDPQNRNNSAANTNNDPRIQSLIQQAVDRATNKLGNDNKALRERLQQLQQSKLSDDEIKAAELEQRTRDIEEREAELKKEKNRMYAISKIKAAGLDDGTDTALGMIDLVYADEEKDIDARVDSLNTYVQKLVKTQVDKAFAAKGRQPGEPAKVGDNKKSTASAAIGKKAAETHKKAQDILKYYTGGNK